MKFVTYRNNNQPNTTPALGLRVSDSKSPEQELNPATGIVIPIAESFEWVQKQGKAPSSVDAADTSDMVRFIAKNEQTLPLARAVFNAFQEGSLPTDLLIPENTTTLMSPVPNPTSVRDGYAFRQHVETMRKARGAEMIAEFDQFPVFYYTNHLATFGPGDFEVLPRQLENLDYELEAAIVVGKECRNVKASEADDYIFGYMVLNDWSARVLQFEEMKLSLGPAKGKDLGNSFGPYLVTREDLESKRIKSENGDAHDLWMKAYINDKVYSEGNVKDMTWTFAQILERASYGTTLYPGEIIGSGTCGTGCLRELNATKTVDNLWLKVGDKVSMEIEGLGRLDNTVVEGKL